MKKKDKEENCLMKLKKKYKVLLIIVIVVIVLTLGVVIYKKFFPKKDDTSNPNQNVATVTNKIEGYDYTLDDRDLELFQNLFHDLKENLESKEMNEDAYLSSISKMFIVDLYTIDNKKSKYDIGGLEYLYQEAVDSFRSKVLDTIYKTVKDNSDSSRKQDLPIVNSVEIIDKQETTYQINEINHNAMEVSLKWTYDRDLGYDKNGTITLIKNENKWCIVAYQPQNK